MNTNKYPLSRKVITDDLFDGAVELYIGGDVISLRRSVECYHPGYPLGGDDQLSRSGITYYSTNPATGDSAIIVWLPNPTAGDPITMIATLCHEAVHAVLKLLQRRVGLTPEQIFNAEEVLAYATGHYFEEFARAFAGYARKHNLLKLGNGIKMA